MQVIFPFGGICHVRRNCFSIIQGNQLLEYDFIKEVPENSSSSYKTHRKKS